MPMQQEWRKNMTDPTERPVPRVTGAGVLYTKNDKGEWCWNDDRGAVCISKAYNTWDLLDHILDLTPPTAIIGCRQYFEEE